MTIFIRPTNTGTHRIILTIAGIQFQSCRLYPATESKKTVGELTKALKLKKGGKK